MGVGAVPERGHCTCIDREAIRLNGDHFRAMKLLGSALYALGDLQAAEAALRASLAICPSYADASCDLGCVLCARQHLEEAKLAFKDAIIMQPKHIEARACLLQSCSQIHSHELLRI